MSPIAILVVGAIVTGLCIAFVWISLHEMKRLARKPEDRTDINLYHL